LNDIKFSIITASYNYEKYISETIESVINQKYTNWEMIVVDDGSTDNSVNIINNYTQIDSRIKLIRHENNENKGLKETLLVGIKNAKNNWLVFVESDDTLTPDYLEKKAKIIKNNPDVKFIFNNVNLFGDDERIKIYDKYFNKCEKILSNKTYPCKLLKDFSKINIIPTFSCVAIQKEIIQNLDFSSPIKQVLDYYLWLQVAKEHKIYYTKEKLTNWRIHKNSYISKKEPDRKILEFNLLKYKILKDEYTFLAYYFILLKLIIKYYRRSLIRISFKEKQIILLGNTICFAKNKV